MESGRKCICGDLRTAWHGKLCSDDTYQSDSGNDDRSTLRYLAGGRRYRREKAWEWRISAGIHGFQEADEVRFVVFTGSVPSDRDHKRMVCGSLPGGGERQAVDTAVLVAYAIIAPIKVQNMILGGGILRSGGKTKYVMVIDLLGTWMFGVPFGLIAAFMCKLSIPYVYFILSTEECIRLVISFVVFKRRKWMQQLK